jgi:hypothetical protein
MICCLRPLCNSERPGARTLIDVFALPAARAAVRIGDPYGAADGAG